MDDLDTSGFNRTPLRAMQLMQHWIFTTSDLRAWSSHVQLMWLADKTIQFDLVGLFLFGFSWVAIVEAQSQHITCHWWNLSAMLIENWRFLMFSTQRSRSFPWTIAHYADWDVRLAALCGQDVPNYLLELIKDCFKDRVRLYDIDDGRIWYTVSACVPQGSTQRSCRFPWTIVHIMASTDLFRMHSAIWIEMTC